jgi:hypothetical protein
MNLNDLRLENLNDIHARPMVMENVQKLFQLNQPLENFPPEIPIPADSGPLVPTLLDYEFPPSLLRRILLTMKRRQPIMLVGDTGTGKTSLVRQLLARLRAPLLFVSCGPGKTEDELIGRLNFDENKIEALDGAVSYALRRGYHVLLDELTALKPGPALAMNDLLERGDTIMLSHAGFRSTVAAEDLIGGQIFPRHPAARIWATDNTGGKMIRDQRFRGSNQLSAAVRRRFCSYKVTYMAPEQEKRALLAAIASDPHLAKDDPNAAKLKGGKQLDLMIELANRMRSGQEEGAVTSGISFGELLCFVQKYLDYGSSDDAFVDAVYTNLEDSDRLFAAEQWHNTFSTELQLTEEHRVRAVNHIPTV